MTSQEKIDPTTCCGKVVPADKRFANILRSDCCTFRDHPFNLIKDFFVVWLECQLAFAAVRRFQTVRERLLEAS
jgi:hypothetical protein